MLDRNAKEERLAAKLIKALPKAKALRNTQGLKAVSGGAAQGDFTWQRPCVGPGFNNKGIEE